ncbi:MAG: HlyC/CorC family transporter [Armatimonadetes bacterium]|nr:HlyC/CorC family transporter [Armatimonadota bacterium]
MSPVVLALATLALVLASAFFVAAEYAVVGARKSRLEAQAKKGDAGAKRVLAALLHKSTYVAGIQTGITFVGIALGAFVEPPVTELLVQGLGPVAPTSVVRGLSIVLVSYPLVVFGELVPKYLVLRDPEKVARWLVGPLHATVLVMKPVVWLFHVSGTFILRLVGAGGAVNGDRVSREELAMIVQASQEEGAFDENQAEFLSKTLRLDRLDANDVMAHRLDVKWLDVNTTSDQVVEKLSQIPHSRIPVCDGDIDEVVGVVYVQDVLKNLSKEGFALREFARPAVFVPENLTLDKAVVRMREAKTQILFVQDEYGGTSGILTLEDVVEEVFGELEDTLESERAPIEQTSSVRVSARGDVRFDELLDFLEMDSDGAPTDTLAQLVIDDVGRMPRLGDAVETTVGKLRVEQLTRNRVVRVGIYLRQRRPMD